MKLLNRKSVVIIYAIMMLGILTGCVQTKSFGRSGVTASSGPLVTLTLPKTKSVFINTNTIAPIISTSSPLPLTNTPHPTFTFIPSPTWTPAPTLSPQESQALAMDLLMNNGGCKLPCWWGMVPGETDWNTARHFLETFVVEIEQGGEGQAIKNGIPVYSTNYGIQYEGEGGTKGGFLILIEKGIISGIETGWDKRQKEFYLPRLMADYGPPDNVFIRAYQYMPDGSPPPFHILLNYIHKSFWADYELRGKHIGSILKGCPQATNPALWLWSPDKEWKFEEMIRVVYGPPVPHAPEDPILPLEEATGMDLKTFYNVFKDLDNQSCLETPANLWH
jgi:hypothetical protein